MKEEEVGINSSQNEGNRKSGLKYRFGQEKEKK